MRPVQAVALLYITVLFMRGDIHAKKEDGLLDLFSSAINSLFSTKLKSVRNKDDKQLTEPKVTGSNGVDSAAKGDSLFLYPFAQTPGDQCDFPQVIGTGPYRIPRWYYNPNVQKCSLFYYSGCCGNGNNFPTLQACQVLCEVDACTQSKDSGVGSLQVPRYYFNKDTKLCTQFLYYGTAGNRNNFATLNECRLKCPENPNPCEFGDPAKDPSEHPLQCGVSAGSNCPANHFCHMGSSASTTMCCPKPPGSIGKCEQSIKPGVGSELLPRWYFDINSQTCKSLQYHGMRGNENNFLTKEECDANCFMNPCGTGQPKMQPGAGMMMCSSTNEKTCPLGYYCHLGYSDKTTVCCPSSGNPCNQPVVTGNGKSFINRWFFNERTKKCESFKYSGQGGNENNFLSEQQCRSACKAYTNVCPSGDPAMDQTGAPMTCKSTSECAQGYWCHIGSTTESTMCCPDAVKNHCDLAVTDGRGTESVQRWYFDHRVKKCTRFNYKGQAGNQNNFRTLQECQASCQEFVNPCPVGGFAYQPDGESTAPAYCSSANGQCPVNSWCHHGATEDTTVCCLGNDNPCVLNVAYGVGDHKLPRWYYNSQMQVCQQFMYFGSKGNQNNFLLKQTCESTCYKFVNPCPVGQPKMDPNGTPLKCNFQNVGQTCSQGYYCHIGANEHTTCCCQSVGNPCELSMSPGVGTETLQRFHYNPMVRQCLPFTYLGTKGNDNNFISEAHCSSQCPVFVNPCVDSKEVSSAPQRCSQNQQCSTNQWCHYGLTEDTTVCCHGNAQDRCSLPLKEGRGAKSALRWYFKQSNRECVPFQYQGFFGNANNFLSKEECEQSCPTFTNVCASGQPLLNKNKPRLCGPTLEACPSDYWCHVGATADLTMCCPGARNPCDTPFTSGTGTYGLQRWYYDINARSCFEFKYSGSYGNPNNFLSKSDCEKTCQTWLNPCLEGTPAMGPNNRPQTCNPKAMLGACPPNYWCHVGGSQETTVCCPGHEDPCTLMQNAGSGVFLLQRWFYDTNDFTCKPFMYKGTKGNRNNFLNIDTCEKECPVFVNPCNGAQQSVQLISCNPANMASCPINSWCHVGATEDTTVCCAGKESPCNMPLAEGSGKANLQRWYFDKSTKQCQHFVYKGLKGNRNNFLTKHHCQEACPVFMNPCEKMSPFADDGPMSSCNPQDTKSCSDNEYCHVGPSKDTTVCCPADDKRCSQPLNSGVGNTSLPRWYFDTVDRACKQFLYRGLKGNQNNFLSYESCANECPIFINPCPEDNERPGMHLAQCNRIDFSCPTSHWCHIGGNSETTLCCSNAKDPCVQPVLLGFGKFSLPRFYYNYTMKQCQPFTYSGLRGNQNNFLTLESCEKQCREIPNPCRKGDLIMVSGSPKQCSPQTSCPANYWCHIGATSEFTTCCEAENEDPCALNLEFGVGAHSLIRWYFNSLTKQCVQFTYRGTKGNQNNFLSQSDCERSCKVYTNPCAHGEPAISTNGYPVKCGTAASENSCPSNYYCHYGETIDSTCCCLKGDTSACEQPLHVGSGTAQINRYFFNALSRSCGQFGYRGSKGNQNNFRTIDECQTTCPVTVNPCREGSPMKDPSGRWQQCNAVQPLNSCSLGYWCHVGGDVETTVCCPGTVLPTEVCNMPLIAGSGNGSMTRFHFDFSGRQCSSFNYKGYLGNQNNFLTKAQCEATCPVFVNPCSEGEPLKGKDGSLLYCTGANPSACPSSTWCHIGADRETSVCCPGAVENVCSLHARTGSGQHNLTRWCFNKQNNKCTSFNYRGLGGNQNNFLTASECMVKCPAYPNPCPHGEPAPGLGGNPLTCTFNPGCGSGYWCHLGGIKETTVCCLGSLPTACTGIEPNEGVGDLTLSRWFYDSSNRQCNMFNYKGLKGNPNNFLTKENCESTCKALQNPCAKPIKTTTYCSPMSSRCPSGEWCHFGEGPETSICCPDSAPNVCLLTMTPGSGDQSLPRFYYNHQSMQCLPLVYRGLHGNQNNFLTKAACEETCLQFPNPCADGAPLMKSSNQVQTCNGLSTVSTCPPGYWCHVGSSLNTTVCCPGTDDPCTVKQEIGFGDSMLPRWYFEPQSKKCSMFTYRGLKGNQNNFVSEDACHVICREFKNPCIGQPATTSTGHVVFCSATNKDNCPVNFWCHLGVRPETTLCCPGATNPCSVPLAPGTGSENVTRWYYNADSRECVQFVYNGIGGNQNNFLTKGECEVTCPAQLCALSVDPGSCNYAQKRYAYDRRNRTCVSFTYGGCGGNLNNFQEMDDCLSVCAKTGYRRKKLL